MNACGLSGPTIRRKMPRTRVPRLVMPLRGFGANDPLTDAGTIDPKMIAQLTVKDAIGITYWKQEWINQIGSMLPGLWVVSERSSSPFATEIAVRSALLGQRSDVPSSAVEPVKAVDWFQISVGGGQNVLASYGFALPVVGMNKYLFSIPDSIELLKQASAYAPVMTLSPSAFAAINAQGGGGGVLAPTGGWWTEQKTITKVAIVGAVVLAGGFALGFWGKKRRGRKALATS